MPPRSLDRGGHSRRQFLTRAGLIVAGGPAFLAACTRDPSGGTADVSGAQPLQLASPQNPKLWPISETNQPIANDLPAEKNATLQIYNYEDYVADEVIASFEDKYDCKVSITTFGDIDEALTKIRQGSIPFDVWIGSGYDLTSRLVATSLIRPLNHTYIPNISNVWDAFANPWYDQQWRYTVPYTVYSTGIGWRDDIVDSDIAALDNPWDTLWDPKWKGTTAVLDDYRSTIEMCLLRAGKDVNSGKAADLDVASQQLTELSQMTKPTVTIQMYEDMPAKKYGQAAMWSGDVLNAAYVGDSERYHYWFAKEGEKGMIDNDLLLALRGGDNPVLSHHFLNHMLDPENALANFNATGYQPPQKTLDPDTMVADELVPANLASVIVRETDFAGSYPALELTTDIQDAWHSVWLGFKAGN